MIAQAQLRNAHPRIAYSVCSLQDFAYPANAYDLVIANLVLHYIADLEEIFQRIAQTLRPGGVFLMNIEHPTFTAGVHQQFSPDGTWPVDNYFSPGERVTTFLGYAVTKQHHTLTQIVMGLIHAGFRIDALEEAMPPVAWREQMPEEMRRPMMLLIKASKPH